MSQYISRRSIVKQFVCFITDLNECNRVNHVEVSGTHREA